MTRYLGLIALAIFAAAALFYLQSEPDDAPARQSSPDRSTQRPQSSASFDFYVLSLSWSPSFCETDGANNRQQCGNDKDYGFVVHGLWPQNKKGYPEFCSTNEPDRVPNDVGRQMFDIMPSMGLIGHQWRKHGSCSGLSQRDYFNLTRQAFERIKIPTEFATLTQRRNIRPDVMEKEFITANPSLRADQIAVTCSGGLMEDVRICLSKDLSFKSCPEVNQRSCRSNSISMPAP